VVAAFLFISYRGLLLQPTQATTTVVPDKSVAVLPFENLSRDPDNAYFAEGVQDEILTRLAAVREEAAAYPVVTGPRTLFEVETPRARLALTYMHRSRRWTITALDDERRAA